MSLKVGVFLKKSTLPKTAKCKPRAFRQNTRGIRIATEIMKLTDKRFWKFEAMMLLCGVLTLLFVFCSCSNRHDLTDNYSVFTYGEGLYNESETDYPIFVSKLGYKGEPPFIPNVKQVWWNSFHIIIEQTNGSWWIITSIDKTLTEGDMFHGPLSIHQKDSIMLMEKVNTNKMKHKDYE